MGRVWFTVENRRGCESILPQDNRIGLFIFRSIPYLKIIAKSSWIRFSFNTWGNFTKASKHHVIYRRKLLGPISGCSWVRKWQFNRQRHLLNYQHLDVLTAWITLTLSHHPSLSVIALSKLSSQYPVSAQCWWSFCWSANQHWCVHAWDSIGECRLWVHPYFFTRAQHSVIV